MSIEPFTIAIPDESLADLRQRLTNARWVQDFSNDDWAYGTNGAYLRELVGYWLTTYDWRRHERAINAVPQFRTVIDGMPIHFQHVRGKGPNPVPLMLNHGWPWTFWDFHKLVGPLTDPEAHGLDPANSFDVIVPSLPGYGFSTPLTTPGLNFWNTADVWVQLMDRLGYRRFATHGGDWGALLSAQLGHKYADRLIGAHITLMSPLNFFSGGTVPAADYAEAEQHWPDRNRQFFQNEAGYYALQSTKPQTAAYALNDSPIGLCAWILEKRRTWSDCNGQVDNFRRRATRGRPARWTMDGTRQEEDEAGRPADGDGALAARVCGAQGTGQHGAGRAGQGKRGAARSGDPERPSRP